MKQRCRNVNNARYERYGARGITVCDEWYDDYTVFRDWALANGYDDSLTIDRIDNDRGYSPDNCRWATYSEQARNTSRNHVIDFNGEKRSLVEWSEITGIPYYTLSQRINRYGWSVEKALTTTNN